MPRPRKCCRVAFLPGVTFFKPAGIPLKLLEEVNLTVDEAEALRLKDVEGLEQAPGAARMNISRPTFQRILASARGKVADAVLNGKAMRIEGGNFETAPQRFRCARGHEWTTSGEKATLPSPGLARYARRKTSPRSPPPESTANKSGTADAAVSARRETKQMIRTEHRSKIQEKKENENRSCHRK